MDKIKGEFLILSEECEHHMFTSLAVQQGWMHRKTLYGDGSESPFDDIWATPDKKNSIHYVVDPIMEVQYLWVWGDEEKTIVKNLINLLPIYNKQDLLDYFNSDISDHDTTVDMLFNLSVAFPNYDQRVFEIYQNLLTNSANPLMRQAVLQAVAFRYWDESRDLISSVAKGDKDGDVREFAEELLQ